MSNTRIEAAIHALGPRRLERVMDDLLTREGYNVDPTSTSGPDGGREAFLYDDDRSGILHCSIQSDWEKKAQSDAEKSIENFDENFDFYIFATTEDPAGTKRDRIEQELFDEWNMNTTVWDYERIRRALVGNKQNHDLVRDHLSVDPKNPHRDIESEVDNLYETLIGRVKSGEAPDGTEVVDRPIVVVHVLPQEAIDDHHDRYVSDLPSPPVFSGEGKYPFEEPELKILKNTELRHTEAEFYSAIHRDGWVEGCFEACPNRQHRNKNYIRRTVDPLIVNYVSSALDRFPDADIYPPFYTRITVLNADECRFSIRNGRINRNSDTLGKDVISLNRVRIDSTDANVENELRKTLFQLWRYAGEQKSENYTRVDTEGENTKFEWDPDEFQFR